MEKHYHTGYCEHPEDEEVQARGFSIIEAILLVTLSVGATLIVASLLSTSIEVEKGESLKEGESYYCLYLDKTMFCAPSTTESQG